MSLAIVQAITVTAELTGTTLSGPAIAVMVQDLSGYSEADVLRSLSRCRRELSGRLTLAGIIERLADADGRPSADEAWALALDARNEALTVVWNNEISQSFAVARPVLDAGDRVGARMAFRDAYERITRDGRQQKTKPEWFASLGWDKGHRANALERAEKNGLLSNAAVAALLPAPSGGVVESALFGNKALPAPSTEEGAEIMRRLADMKKILSSSKRREIKG